MQIVIEIPEEKLSMIKNKMYCGVYDAELYKAIANGTPLPKGHGRLIDESKVKNCGWNFIDHHAKTDAPTIIEAESEV